MSWQAEDVFTAYAGRLRFLDFLGWYRLDDHSQILFAHNAFLSFDLLRDQWLSIYRYFLAMAMRDVALHWPLSFWKEAGCPMLPLLSALPRLDVIYKSVSVVDRLSLAEGMRVEYRDRQRRPRLGWALIELQCGF